MSHPNAETERVVARVRRHMRHLTGPVVFAALILGGLTYGLNVVPQMWARFAILGGAAALLLLGCVLPFVSWLAQRLVITTRRIVVRRGVFMRVRQELFHSRGYVVAVRRGPVQAMFRSGDLLVSVEGMQPMVIRDVPMATLIQSALGELVEQHTRRSGTGSAMATGTTGFMGTGMAGPGTRLVGPPMPGLATTEGLGGRRA